MKHCDRQLHVFDVDHTLFTCNLTIQFGKFLLKRKKLSFFRFVACFYYYSLYKFLNLPIHWLHEKVFHSFFKGSDLNQMMLYFDEFWYQEADLFFFSPIKTKLDQALKEGYIVVLLSASPDFITGRIAHHLSVLFWGASSYLVSSEGLLDSFESCMEGEAKALWLDEFCVQHNLSQHEIFAYSDSVRDLPLLKKARHGIVVNPGKKLSEIALKYGWTEIR